MNEKLKKTGKHNREQQREKREIQKRAKKV